VDAGEARLIYFGSLPQSHGDKNGKMAKKTRPKTIARGLWQGRRRFGRHSATLKMEGLNAGRLRFLGPLQALNTPADHAKRGPEGGPTGAAGGKKRRERENNNNSY